MMGNRYIVLVIVLSLLSFGSRAVGHANYTGYSGAPGSSGTCAASCHGASGGTMTVSGFPASYVPGQAYTIVVRHSGGSSIVNFNGSVREGTGSINAGNITAGLYTSTYNVSGETNGVHFASNNRDSGDFIWTAPSPGVGDVKLYVAGLQGTFNGLNTTIVLTATMQAATHDVGCAQVMAPSGTIDSGLSVAPACTVVNYGTAAETYRVRARIGTFYNDTARVTSQAPGARTHVTFPAYANWPRGTHAVTCTTELTGDEAPENDSANGSVTVRVHDVGAVALLAPSGSIDSGTVVTPACTVANFGTVTETYRVRMRIGAFYNDTARVNAQTAGARTYVTFPAWTAQTVGGPYTVTCTTELTSDAQPANNRQTGSVTVTRPIIHDVGATRIVAPTGTIDSTATVTPACSVYNYGNQTETYRVRLRVGSFYNDTARVTSHAAGTRAYVTFPVRTGWPRGTFAVTCTTELAGDATPSNDRTTGSVMVIVHDVSCVSLRSPSGSVDSGTVLTPACTVANFGTVAEIYRVRIRIGAFYNDTARVTSQAPGARTYVTFPAWTALTVGGPYTVTCTTELAADMVATNDRQTGSVTVTRPIIHDVGATRILAPTGTVDTGQAVTPACSVFNYGNQTETYRVRFKMGTFYNDTARVTSHAAGTRAYVAFPAYANWPRGTHAVTCTTELAGDAAPANDKVSGNVTVRVHDVGCVSIRAPSGSIDSGTVVTPACTVANFGTVAETYRVRMRIGAFYNDTARVTGQAAGARTYVTFPTWTAMTVGGPYTVTCTTELAADVVAANDAQFGSVSVRRPATQDVGVTRILAPVGIIDSSATVTPACSVYNYGTLPQSYRVRMRVGSFYNDTARVNGHAPGTRQYVTFPVRTGWPRGTHVVTCTTELAGDGNPQNDRLEGSVTVAVHDVGCALVVAPSGSVDSGTVVTPACTVVNYGSVAETYRVRMRIGALYDDTVRVVAQAAGARTYVTFPPWAALNVGGPYMVRCSTELAGDVQPNNDRAVSSVVVAPAPRHDVGVRRIIEPTGTIDSTASVVPACSVYNYGNRTETYRVRLRVGTTYEDTALAVAHAAGTVAYVTFPAHAGWPRGRQPVRCTTELAGDVNPANDARSDSAQFRVADVAALAVRAPAGTVDSGSAVVPRLKVFNYGTHPAIAPAVLRIYTMAEALVAGRRFDLVYADSVNVSVLMGDSAFAAFDTWVAQPVGSFRVEAFVRLGNDMNRTNDTAGNVFTVRSAGHDVGVARIVAPVGTVDSGEQIVPAAVVGNYGGLAETFPVRMRIGTFYQRETTVTLAAGALDTVRFAVWDVRQPGTHVVRCSTMLASDQNPANDWREDSVTVTGLGIEAATLRPARFTLEPARPNPFSDRTEVRFALPVATEARLDVFDASGARVRTLGSGLLPLGRHAVVWDGRDEHGRTVGPGVYHCVLTAAGFRAVQKLVRLR